MKKLIIIMVAALVTAPLFGWGREGHATVAKIAEDHLTKTTKAALNKYLNGESIVIYASYADEHKNDMIIDYGFVGEDGLQKRAYPHTFETDITFKPTRVINDNGRYVKNCLVFIEQYAKELQEGAKDMDPKERFEKIVMLVHWLGDMHCPMHIRYYPLDMEIGHQNVIFRGEPYRYHTYWDKDCIVARYPWSFSDLAHICDICDKDEIEEICAGDVWDWAEQCARDSYPVHQMKEGDKLTAKIIDSHLPLVRQQLRNGGYRLAHTLNMIFDAKYAKKYSKR